MTVFYNPKRTEKRWTEITGLGPEAKMIDDPAVIAATRKAIDGWSNKRLLRVSNLGSLIDIGKLMMRQITVVHHRLLFVTRTARVVHEPFKGQEWYKRDPPETLFHLPFRPPYVFERHEEVETEVVGMREVRSCSTCKSKGEVRCSKCSGKGSYKCPFCGGAGQTQRTEYKNGKTRKYSQQCSRCRGSSWVDCSPCRKSGWIQCSTCEGYGKVLRKAVVSTSYEPEFLTDVLYRGEFPAKMLADPEIPSKKIISATAANLEYIMKGEVSPSQAKWDANEEALKYSPYLKFLEKDFGSRVTKDTKIYNWHVEIRQVPVLEVPYKYGKSQHKIFLYGEDNRVQAMSSPSAVAAMLESTFRKLKGLLKRKQGATNPEEAILKACIWMCWADGKLHDREHELIFGFIRNSSLPKDMKAKLGKTLKTKPKKFDLAGRLTEVEERRRCAKFCWQVTISDGEIDPAEEQVMSELADQLGLRAELDQIKMEAEMEMLVPEM